MFMAVYKKGKEERKKRKYIGRNGTIIRGSGWGKSKGDVVNGRKREKRVAQKKTVKKWAFIRSRTRKPHLWLVQIKYLRSLGVWISSWLDLWDRMLPVWLPDVGSPDV
jgi:hypothetical protein